MFAIIIGLLIGTVIFWLISGEFRRDVRDTWTDFTSWICCETHNWFVELVIALSLPVLVTTGAIVVVCVWQVPFRWM